jgi:hypothetical protein
MFLLGLMRIFVVLIQVLSSILWNQLGNKQGLINSALKATFQRELRDFLRAGMFFSDHPEWVSNWALPRRPLIILEPVLVF